MSEAQGQGNVTPESADIQPEQAQQPEQDAPFFVARTQDDFSKKAGLEREKIRDTVLKDVAAKFGYDDPAELDAVAEALKTWEAENETADEQLAKTKTELKQEREARTRLEKEYGLKDALRDAGIKPERIPHALKLADFDAEPAQAVEGVKEASPEWFGRERAVAEDTTEVEPQKLDYSQIDSETFQKITQNVLAGHTPEP